MLKLGEPIDLLFTDLVIAARHQWGRTGPAGTTNSPGDQDPARIRLFGNVAGHCGSHGRPANPRQAVPTSRTCGKASCGSRGARVSNEPGQMTGPGPFWLYRQRSFGTVQIRAGVRRLNAWGSRHSHQRALHRTIVNFCRERRKKTAFADTRDRLCTRTIGFSMTGRECNVAFTAN